MWSVTCNILISDICEKASKSIQIRKVINNILIKCIKKKSSQTWRHLNSIFLFILKYQYPVYQVALILS